MALRDAVEGEISRLFDQDESEPHLDRLRENAEHRMALREEFRLARERPYPDLRPLLVGEANPYGGRPELALFPFPERSAGGRLCRLVLGLEPRDYLRRFARRNLCPTAWKLSAARAAAAEVRADFEERANPGPPLGRGSAVLLGSRVCAAFGLEFRPFTTMAMAGYWRAAILPHPGGLCRLWNEPGAVERARAALAEAGIDLALEEGGAA